MRTRRAAAVVSGILLVAALSPVLRRPWNDGFPLSTYPMFAFERPTKLTMDYALGITATGAPRYLSPAMLGTSEVLQAFTTIATAKSQHELPALCHAIADRVAHASQFTDVIAVRIVTGTHDAVEFLVRREAGHESELTRCLVAR